MPSTRERQGEHGVNSSRLHHRTEGLIKVHTRPLRKTAKNLARLIPLEGAIRLKLMLEDPLASDDIGPRHKIPCLILQQSTVFVFHSCSLIGVG
jgi:hypothetical protein